MPRGCADCRGPRTSRAGELGTPKGAGQGRWVLRPGAAAPGVRPALPAWTLPSPPSPSSPLPSWVLGQREGCGRAEPQGACGGGRKGRGAPEHPAGREKPTDQREPRASAPLAPAMWGLLLALAAFAPAVDVGLGASGASVLGLALPATTEARGSTPAPQSSPVQPPAGKDNGERPDRGPASRLPSSPVCCMPTLPRHTHTRAHTLPAWSLCADPSWTHTSTHSFPPPRYGC